MENQSLKRDRYDVLIDLIKNGIDVYGGSRKVSFAGVYDSVYNCKFYQKIEITPVNHGQDLELDEDQKLVKK